MNSRRRSLLRAAVGIALCTTLRMILSWDTPLDDYVYHDDERRQLAYLDAVQQKPVPYGRHLIDQNYQSLMWPTEIDGMMFRKQKPEEFETASTNDDDGANDDKGGSSSKSKSVCDDIFLFMPQPFAHNGHGSQLNSYILASLVATFSNRAMVLLEPPNELNVFKSNSQFGCPPEAWRTERRRKGGEPVKVGWNEEFPVGVTRLIRHPAWLSRGCSVPCIDEYGYEDWDALRTKDINATFEPAQIQCGGSGKSKRTNVVVMGGDEVRHFFSSYYKYQMLDRSTELSMAKVSDWVTRLGARPHESRVFANATAFDRRDTWDYVSALIARSGLLRFQPWIGRDVEDYMKTHIPDLDLNEQYDAIHVRRGDKLFSDARRLVRLYWQERGQYNEDTGVMPRDYIPFQHYLTQFENVSTCLDGPRTVYVSTDDPAEIKAEIDDLPKDSEGFALLVTNSGEPMCHKFQFIFTTYDAESAGGYHLQEGYAKGTCEERYSRNIASIADLMLLSKSNIVVMEYNSNWGRLVRTFRLRLNDSQRIMNGARPVLQKGELKVAWGRKLPGPPGW